MAMKTLTNRMNLVAKQNAGRTVTARDMGSVRRIRFSAYLSYPRCLEGLAEHEPIVRGVTLGDDPTAIRAGRLGGPRLGWRSSRLLVARRVGGKSPTQAA